MVGGTSDTLKLLCVIGGGILLKPRRQIIYRLLCVVSRDNHSFVAALVYYEFLCCAFNHCLPEIRINNTIDLIIKRLNL